MVNKTSKNFLNATREILAIWNKFAEAAAVDGEGDSDFASRFWGDRGNPRNVIVDAEALLTFLYPESAIDRLSFHDRGGVIAPSDALAGESIARIAVDVDSEYKGVLPGSAVRGIVRVLLQFFDDNGGMKPEFSAGSYLDVVDDPTDTIVSSDGVVDKKAFIAFTLDRSQPEGNIALASSSRSEALRRETEVLDAYTFSISVSVSTLQLIERWFPGRSRVEGVDRLRDLAHARLTEGLEGLVDSFSVSTVDQPTWETGTKREWPENSTQLKAIRKRLGRLKDGIVEEDDQIAFEVGWSWGPVAKEYRVLPAGEQEQDSYRDYPHDARNVPYLYFTVGALDGLEDVLSVELQTASILNEREQELAYHLRILSDLASQYWTQIAFNESEGSWAIEDVPWTTIDGSASEYWTLFLLRVALPSLPNSDHYSSRLVDLAQELGQRARITRKPSPPASDSALDLHWPGEILVLETDEDSGDGKKLMWRVYDFSPQLLKLSGQLLEKISNPRDRAEVADLISHTWLHLTKRREASGNGKSTWDSLENVYKQWYKKEVKASIDILNREEFSVNSWYMTERVVEALVAVAAGEMSRPLVPVAMRELLFELVAEMDYQYAKLDLVPGEDHVDLDNKRTDVHIARRLLLERDSAGCMAKLVRVMHAED